MRRSGSRSQSEILTSRNKRRHTTQCCGSIGRTQWLQVRQHNLKNSDSQQPSAERAECQGEELRVNNSKLGATSSSISKSTSDAALSTSSSSSQRSNLWMVKPRQLGVKEFRANKNQDLSVSEPQTTALRRQQSMPQSQGLRVREFSALPSALQPQSAGIRAQNSEATPVLL